MRFTDVLDRYGVDYRTEGHEHCRPGWVQLDCPACSPNAKRFRLGYNLYGGYTNCWACGPKRSWNTLAELFGVNAGKVKGILEEVTAERVPQEIVVRGKLERPAGEIVPLRASKPHKNYVKARGFSLGELEQLWNVQALTIGVNLSWRLYLPIVFEGDEVSWTTRSLSDAHERRYWSASPKQEKVNHKELLYGEDYCTHTVIVVEGPTDVWKVGPGAVCTFGTGYSRSQVYRMARFLKRVVCYDAEPAAQRRAKELMDQLAPFDGETLNVVLDAKDPGSAPAREIRALRKMLL